MTKTKYMHYVIAEYLSTSMTCVFAMENYRQETSVDANCELRNQFNTCMEAYEEIYNGRETWPLSTEDLVDHRTVAHFRFLAEQQANIFLEAFERLIPLSKTEKFDMYGVWKRLRQNQQITPAILNLIKELREWEEEHILFP